MITLSALGDEIDPGLDAQMDWLDQWRIRFIDVRAIDGMNIARMTFQQARQYYRKMADRGFRTPCVCSPIGKTSLDEDFPPQLELLRHCFNIARAFETNHVRVFSFYPSPGRRIEDQRGEVMDRLHAMVSLAGAGDMVLLHENEKRIYGSKPPAVKDIFDTIRSKHLRGIYDPGNYVAEGVAPFDEGWCKGLAETTSWFHVKDKRLGEAGYVAAGRGDGQFPQVLADLKARNWSGVMAIEPHLSESGAFKGMTGPRLFGEAVVAIRALLEQVGLV